MDQSITSIDGDIQAEVTAAESPLRDEDEQNISESLFYSAIDTSEFFSDEHDAMNTDESKNESNNVENALQGASISESRVAQAQDNRSAIENPSRNIAHSNEASNNRSWSWNSILHNQTKVNSITFNRERTCLILSTSHGVRIRTLESIHYDLFRTQSNSSNTTNPNNNTEEWIYDVPFQSGATYAQLLLTSCILAVIQPISPRCCLLYNAKDAINPLAALPMSAAVKRVELTKKVLCCITADGRLHVFHMNNVQNGERPVWIQTLNVMHPMDSIRNISRGNNIYFAGAYFDLSPNQDDCYLVCKSFNGTAGTIRVYDPTNVTESESSMNANIHSVAASTQSNGSKKVRRSCHLHTTIDAHEHPVIRMLISSGSSSSFVATASTKGTTIRVFGLPSGQQLYEWHRGSRSCNIMSLSWNGLGDRLVSYGSSNTIHVFEWSGQQKKKTEYTGLEHSHADDIRDFEEIREDTTQGDATNDRVSVESSNASIDKQFFKRIGATIRRHTIGSNTPPTSLKHRSFAKLKYQSTETKHHQQLIVALLDRHDINVINGTQKVDLSREDTIVMCSLNGKLQQYSVQSDGSTKLVQLDDMLIN